METNAQTIAQFTKIMHRFKFNLWLCAHIKTHLICVNRADTIP